MDLPEQVKLIDFFQALSSASERAMKFGKECYYYTILWNDKYSTAIASRQPCHYWAMRCRNELFMERCEISWSVCMRQHVRALRRTSTLINRRHQLDVQFSDVRKRWKTTRSARSRGAEGRDAEYATPLPQWCHKKKIWGGLRRVGIGYFYIDS